VIIITTISVIGDVGCSDWKKPGIGKVGYFVLFYGYDEIIMG